MPDEVEFLKISKAKKWTFLCYIPIFNVITCPLAAVKYPDLKDVRFHVRQGLVLFAIWILTLFLSFFSNSLSLMVLGIDFLFYFSSLYFVYIDVVFKIPFISNFAMMIPEFYIYCLLTGKEPDAEWIEEKNEKKEEIK